MTQFPLPVPATQVDRVWNARLERVQSKLLHAAELIADKMVEMHARAEPELDAPIGVRRREMANALQIWRKCPRRTCAHAQACRGEPAHCLRACMPALPPGALAAYVGSSRRRRRKR